MASLLPKIDVEREMQSVVRAIGGLVLSEHLAHPPKFENADFVFHGPKIIAELKCLTDDNVFSDANRAKVENIWRRCFVKKLVEKPYPNNYDWRQLPKSVQNEIFQINTRSIKKRVQKANRQIRETKAQLGLTDYTGCLFIANDGIVSLPPPAFIHATQLALRNDFSEIRHFVFLTANLYTRMRRQSHPSLFWVTFNMQDGCSIDGGFLDELGTAWRLHCARLMGVIGIEGEIEDMQGFWESDYI